MAGRPLVPLLCSPHGQKRKRRVREDAGSGLRVKRARGTYLDGDLEIRTVSRAHEHLKKLLARLIEANAEEVGLALNGFGSETFRNKVKSAGLEPDECYCLGPEKPIPDLAIEIALTSGGIDKLEIYRRLGFAEVWPWLGGAVQVHRLGRDGYRRAAASQLLPGIDLAALSKILRVTDRSQQTEAVRRFRLACRARRRRSRE